MLTEYRTMSRQQRWLHPRSRPAFSSASIHQNRHQNMNMNQHRHRHQPQAHGISGDAGRRAPKRPECEHPVPPVSLQRDSGKQLRASAVRGGQIFEKASSRMSRNRAALEKSGDAETSVALGSRSRNRAEQQQQQQQQQPNQQPNQQRRRKPQHLPSRRLPEVEVLQHQFAQKSFCRSAMIRDGLKRKRQQELTQPRRHAVTASVTRMSHKTNAKAERRTPKSSRVVPSHLQRAQKQRRTQHKNRNNNNRERQNPLADEPAPKAPVSPRTANAANDQVFAANVSARVNGLLDSDNESGGSDQEDDNDNDDGNFMDNDENDQTLTNPKRCRVTITVDSDSDSDIDSASDCHSDRNKQYKENGNTIRNGSERNSSNNNNNNSSSSSSDQHNLTSTLASASKKVTAETRVTNTEMNNSFPEETSTMAAVAAPGAKTVVVPPVTRPLIKHEVIDLSNDDLSVKIEPETTNTTTSSSLSSSPPSSSKTNSSHASVTQFLIDEGIGRNADRHEMEGYATEFLRLGLHSKSMILDALLDKHYVPDPEPVVRKWGWMKDFHKNVFLNWIRIQPGSLHPQSHGGQRDCVQGRESRSRRERRGSFDL